MRRTSLATLLGLALATTVIPAEADPRPPGAETPAGPATEEGQRAAQTHFQRAKDLYQAGSYREAIAELEIARKLDPGAKDLVMNLGIVHERLGLFDEAIAHFTAYLDMEGVSAAERARVEAMITRIEGAKRELPAEPSAAEPLVYPPPPSAERPRRGRVDALTITAGSLAAAGLLVGTGAGIHALTTRPSGFVTGRDGTYADLEQKTADAHTMALVADVGFGVGAAFALATAWLYFGRTKDAGRGASSPERRAAAESVRVAGSATASGASVVLGGSF